MRPQRLPDGWGLIAAVRYRLARRPCHIAYLLSYFETLLSIERPQVGLHHVA